MGREKNFKERTKRFFKIPEKRISSATLQREFDAAKGRFPVIYGDEQFAKPGTLPDPISLHYAFDMVKTRNPNLVEPSMFLGAWEIEREAVSMLADLFNHPNYKLENYDPIIDPVFGWFTDGGTTSILQSTWAFRNKYFRELQKKKDSNFNLEYPGIIREEGLIGLIEKGFVDVNKSPVILASVDMHFAGDKSIDILGLGSKNIIRYDLNPDFTTDYSSLETTVKSLLKEGREVMFAIVPAGSTDIGRVEDVNEFDLTLRKLGCKIPIIVDAAQQYMMASLLSENYPSWDFRVKNVEAIIADPHKTDASTYPGSLVIFRNKDIVHDTQNEAGYLHADDKLKYDMQALWKLEPSLHTSRSPIGAISTWTHLLLKGKEKLIKKYEKVWGFTQEIADYIKKSNYYNLILEPQTGVIALHVKDFDDNKANKVYKSFESDTKEPRFYISFADNIRLKTAEDHKKYKKMKLENKGEKIIGLYGGLYIQVMQHTTEELVEKLIDRLDRKGAEILNKKL